MNKSTEYQIKVWGRTWKEMISKNKFPEITSYQRQWHSKLIDSVTKETDMDKMRVMLECGCGNGIFGLEFANRLPKLNLCLSDLSESALKYSKLLRDKLIIKYPTENFDRLSIKYSINNMFKLKFKNNIFDFVINGGTIEHYNDKEIKLLVEEMLRVTNSSGVIVVVVPNIKNIDLTLKRIKLFIRNNSFGLLLKHMIDYGGNDERNITFNVFKKATKDIKKIESIIYAKHPIAFPRFIHQSILNKSLMLKLEQLLANLGLNWANIFIIKKKK